MLQVLSKNIVSDYGSVTVNGSTDLRITREMGPSSRYVVYYMMPDGEILADGFNFVVEDVFENKVSLTFETLRICTLSFAYYHLPLSFEHWFVYNHLQTIICHCHLNTVICILSFANYQLPLLFERCD